MWLWAVAGIAWALPGTVRDAVEVGDCVAVLAALPAPASAEERLAAGWCRAQRGDFAGAVPILAEVNEGPLVPWARWVRAEALLDAERAAEALEALDGLVLPGTPGLRVRVARGRALVTLSRSLQARDDLRDLLATPVGVEARYWLAVGGEQRGEREAAVATYRRVWADDPFGPWAERAALALERLEAPVPDLVTTEGRALVEDRIRTLSASQQHAEALALTERLGKKASTSPATGLALADARFAARDYPGAVEAFAAVLGAPEVAAGSARPLFDYALATSRTGDYDTAAVIYGRLVDLHPNTAKGDLASFKLGYLEYDRGRCETARARFAEHVARMPDSGHLDEALWFDARCAWRTGDLDGARASWEALIARRPFSSLVPGAVYWTARARGRGGDAEAEVAGLDDVLRRFPTSGYAWFAAERLGRVFPARGTPGPPPWPTGTRPETLGGAIALVDAGFPAWARAELEGMPVPADDGGRLAVGLARLAAGDYRGARALVADCPGAAADATAPVRALCTPRPEASIVQRVAARYGLDANLPYAIMTAESALDPTVTSIAGARGLMQLMPAEAPRIHAALYGEQPFDAMRLYEGPYNASLGTAELGLKQQALGDLLAGSDLPAVIASYNGGEDAVRRWVATWEAAPEPDEFTEDIGYTETRQYVKRVLGHLMAYRWAYGD